MTAGALCIVLLSSEMILVFFALKKSEEILKCLNAIKSDNVSGSWTRWRCHLKRKMNDVSRGISEHFMFTVPLIKMPNFSTGYCDGPANTVDLKYSGICDRCSLIRRNLWDINMVSRAEFLFELMTLRGVITPKLFPARPENCSKDTSKAKSEGWMSKIHSELISQWFVYGETPYRWTFS